MEGESEEQKAQRVMEERHLKEQAARKIDDVTARIMLMSTAGRISSKYETGYSCTACLPDRKDFPFHWQICPILRQRMTECGIKEDVCAYAHKLKGADYRLNTDLGGIKEKVKLLHHYDKLKECLLKLINEGVYALKEDVPMEKLSYFLRPDPKIPVDNEKIPEPEVKPQAKTAKAKGLRRRTEGIGAIIEPSAAYVSQYITERGTIETEEERRFRIQHL